MARFCVIGRNGETANIVPFHCAEGNGESFPCICGRVPRVCPRRRLIDVTKPGCNTTVIFAFFALKCADVKLELNEKVKLPSESILATPESKAKKESASGSSAGTLASAANPLMAKLCTIMMHKNNTQNFFKDIHNLPLSHVFPSITESEIIPSATS